MRRILIAIALVACVACKAADAVAKPTQVDCTLGPPVTVTPANASLAQGDTLRAQATAWSCGPVLNPNFRWASSDTSVATVDVAGLVLARTSGRASIIVYRVEEPLFKGALALTVH